MTSARLSYHARNQNPGTGSEGQNRGGWRTGEQAQETLEAVIDAMSKTVETWAVGQKRRQESVDPVDVDRGYFENSKEAERKAQGAQGLNKYYIESMPPLPRLIRGFPNEYH